MTVFRIVSSLQQFKGCQNFVLWTSFCRHVHQINRMKTLRVIYPFQSIIIVYCLGEKNLHTCLVNIEQPVIMDMFVGVP